MIEVRELCVCHGGQTILQNVSFSVDRGHAAALVGANGSGKSTLLSVLAGSIAPSGGAVSLGGKVAYLPQENALIEELTFADNLRFFAALAGVKVPKTLPFGTESLRKKRIARMSGGQKRLCSIVCTLLADADIYLLDEPCAALDTEHREAVLAHVRDMVQAGKTVLYVGHDPAEYAFCDTVLTVEDTAVKVREASYV